jgi:hypothetical protein
VPDEDAVLAVGRELRPVRGDRCVDVELAAVGEQQGRQRRHGLRRRVDVDDRVAVPRRAVVVDDATPDVDDQLTVEHDGGRRAHVETGVEVRRQRRPHPLEALVAGPVHLSHVPPFRMAGPY